MNYDSKKDTETHILTVLRYIAVVCSALVGRATDHDASKLAEPEKSIFDEFTPKLKTSTYGSEEYKSFLTEMGTALKHHYENNRHHPEHFIYYECNGCFKRFDKEPKVCDICGYSQFTNRSDISQMTLVDIIEMLCDWKAATERHADGDILKSLDVNKKRFEISDQLVSIMRNTVKDLGWD